jgi:lipopolysaccharide transport system permease protein
VNLNLQTQPKIIEIKPSRGWPSLGIGDLWEHRELFSVLLWRKFKGKHRQMAFGYLWVILVPLINMFVFSFIFGKMAKLPSEGFPYLIFTYVALLPWQFFANATRDASRSLLEQRRVISKIYFPRLLIPLAAVTSALVEFMASFIVLIIMMAIFSIAPTWKILMLPFFIFLTMFTALGVGLWLACLTIKFHDVMVGLGFVLNILQFLTPVAYSSTLITGSWKFLYKLNPMAVVCDGFRWSLLGTTQTPGLETIISSILVCLFTVTGAYFFRRTERTIVDQI